jgi:RHS repeat-associated protein
MVGTRVTALIVALTAFLAFSAANATDPGDRAFTPLGGGNFGHPAEVGARGNLSVSLPFLFPSPRGDLPLPFSVNYTGTNSVGAAGVGWDIPIAGVTRQQNLSRRKPIHRFQTPADPAPPLRLVVDIGEGPMLMSPTSTVGVYQTFSNGYFELKEVGSSTFVGRDASGRVWVFQKLPALYDDDFFPLTQIADVIGSNHVDLLYDVYDKFSTDPVKYPYTPDQLSMRELVLRELRYSHDGSGTCPKYRIELEYRKWENLNYPASYPDILDLDIQAGHPRARSRVLSGVTLQSNANSQCISGGPPTLPHEITERSYHISYVPDEVTGQPRLAKVDMFGTRDPGTDASTGVPVVAYQYGSPLVPIQSENAPISERIAPTGPGLSNPFISLELRYAAAEQFSLPTGPLGTNDGFAASYGAGAGTIYGLVRDFQDLNGDGRADFVTLNANSTNPIIAVNRPSSLGNDYSTLDTPVALPNSPAAPYNLGTPDLAFNLPVVAAIDNTYQQVIDFNGDGRPDIIIATDGRNPSGERDPNFWKVLINTPGPSGQPSDIVWLERNVDISALRAAIQQHFALSPVASDDQNSKPLPVMRTHQVGVFDNNTMIESGIVTQWKLIDVNGDGFPDLVFDQLDVTAWIEQRCDSGGNNCKQVTKQDRPAGNSLMVIYHTGPMMAGSGADSQSNWNGPPVTLRGDGACGVERLAWIGGGVRQLKCGFMEVDGDGLFDYVIDDSVGIRAIRSSGLAQAHDVRLPENQNPSDYAQQEAKRSISLPGPVGRVKDPLSTVCTPSTAGNQTYEIEQVTALLDITGDGIADYIYFGSRGALSDGTPLSHPALTAADRGGPQGWWFMAGTGVGFAAPKAIQAPADLPFGLYISRATCDGTSSNVILRLQDIDGDGRLELVRSTGSGSARIAKIVDAAGQLGAHAAGRVTGIDNRFGSVTRITYGSAKSDALLRQGVPFPEIVVTQMEQTAERGLGSGLAPVHYAYGSPEFLYHPLLGRWIFNGYRRRVELLGEPAATPGFVTGTAKISDALAFSEQIGDANGWALAGRVRDVSYVSGTLSSDARAFLSDSALASATGNQHVTWRTQALPGSIPILVPLEEECYQTPPPQAPGIFGDLTLCRRSMTPYVGERTSWEGEQAYPSTNSVASHTEITAVDDYARPIKIEMDGDRARTDDDYCVDISYALPTAGAPFISDAPYTVRVEECKNRSLVFAGVRYLYDGLAEGGVSNGLPTGRILERYDVNTGVLLDQRQSGTLERDGFGNVIQLMRSRPDGANATTSIYYDEFGLKPIRTETTATGLAQPLIAQTTRDLNTLLPTTTSDSSGVTTQNVYDRFGRLTRVAITLPGNSTSYVLLDTAYLGFDGAPSGREVQHRFYDRWTDEASAETVDPAKVTTYTEQIDELGRRRYGVLGLGPDYGSQSLIVNFVNYDTLGRPSFAADPFQSTDDHPRYGTSFTYRADDRPECAIVGSGPQSTTTTDETLDRYPMCISYLFQNGQMVVRGQGPNELAQGTPQSGAYDEETLSATGKTLDRTRSKNGSLLEKIQYQYDRLGGISSITRWADPQGGTGAATWSFANDSFGSVTTMREPAGLARQYTYDAWGRVATVGWTDSTGILAVQRGISFQYDGLARLLRSEETLNGSPQPATTTEYFYDVSSGLPQQLDTSSLLGRLSYARTPQNSVFLGYDPLGRLTTISRSDGDASAYHAERATFGPSGQIDSLDLLLPDTGHSPERISYDYDSARHLRGVDYHDAAGLTKIWRALKTDIFGRVLTAQLGNGALEEYVYRQDHRRELQSARTEVGTRSREVVFKGYDGAMLLKGLSERDSLTSSTDVATAYQFDARNALARAIVQSASGPVADTSYTYDGLGNLRSIINNIAGETFEIRPDDADPDRVCTTGSPGSPITPCSYRYDAVGDIWQIHDTGVLFGYDAAGRLRSADRAGQRARLDYDPFGAIASLNIRNGNIERREQSYGGVSALVSFFDSAGNPVDVGGPGMMFQNFVERHIVSPIGTLAVVRRPNAGQPVILYPIGDYQGTRAVIDSSTTPTETISYSPFGSVLSDSGDSNSLTWWPYQWNGGHILEGFGLVALGQRILDPSIGRFLQRDPLMPTTTAGSANPYAFAWNNPVKFTDRSGAQPSADQGGTIARGVAAFGIFANMHVALVPGEKVDPYIEMKWACSTRHDCISEVEMLYPLTDFERQLRHEFRPDKPSSEGWRWAEEYHVILDRLSGAIIGYAMFETNVVDIYNREGVGIATLGRSEGTTATWFQPGDLFAGAIASWAGIGVSMSADGGVRGIEAAVEADMVDEAAAGGLAPTGARRSIPWTYGSTGSALGFTTREGDIIIHWSLKPGTKLFDETLTHEGVHRFLTPLRGPLLEFRRDAMEWFYENSHLLKYTEEVWAHTKGTGSFLQGLVRAYHPGYGINLGRLAIEGGLYSYGLHLSYEGGQSLRGLFDAP